MNRPRTVLFPPWVVMAPAVISVACSACGEAPQSTPLADASVQDTRPDIFLESGWVDTKDSASEDHDSTTNGKVPPGWSSWTGWSPDCPLYFPEPGAELPPPIEWEPCGPAVRQELDCRQMKHVWNEDGIAIGIFPKLDTSGDVPLIAFSRVWVDGDIDRAWRLVAEPDGAIRMAMLQVNAAKKECAIAEEAVNEGRYLFFTYFDRTVEGFLAGPAKHGPPETVLQQARDPSLLSNWSISKDWIVQRRGDRIAWTWDLQTQHLVHTGAKDPDGLRGFLTTVIGKDVFVEVGDGLPSGVVTWNLEQGSRPLIRWVGDATRGAGLFGTDGKDMVWTYVEGPLGDNKFEKVDVMTAPYTTEASQVKARRLRSDVKAFDPYSWVVGCGYAARRAGLDDPYQNALFIVRLSDGVSWILSGTNETPKNQWGIPLGITCDEVFTTASQKPSNRILRIRLDSLGPGTPPD